MSERVSKNCVDVFETIGFYWFKCFFAEKRVVLIEMRGKNNLELVRLVTLSAADRVNDLVFRYGHLAPNEAEREMLQFRVGEILSAWSKEIISLGGIPMELWTVVIQTEEGDIVWRLNNSEFYCNRAS
jgi:hypothetical protein